jgi:arylsulfatase A-like enzyme
MKVLVIAVRGLQAGALGCYGNPWIDTPAFNRLAAESCVFDWHFADAADPAGARRAWRSGRYHLPDPSAGGAEGPAAADLLALLGERGIPTCLLVDASRPAPKDFAHGWGEVGEVAPTEEEESALEAMLNAAEAQLEDMKTSEHGLLWLDLATVLPPWDVPAVFREPYFQEEEAEADEEGEEEQEAAGGMEEGEDLEPIEPLPDPPQGLIDPDDVLLYERLHSSYAAAVSYLDAGLGQLFERLDEDVCLVVTADTGQNLGEHGLVGPHRPWLHDELIHLPLIVRLPEQGKVSRHVDALTQTVDLAPTLASLFGLALPEAHGHVLLPLIRGAAEGVRPFACAGLQVGEGIEWAVRTSEWVFLHPLQPHPEDAGRRAQLYIKPDDRWEVNNVVQHHLDLADQLEQMLRTLVAATRQPGPLQVPPLPEG